MWEVFGVAIGVGLGIGGLVILIALGLSSAIEAFYEWDYGRKKKR